MSRVTREITVTDRHITDSFLKNDKSVMRGNTINPVIVAITEQLREGIVAAQQDTDAGNFVDVFRGQHFYGSIYLPAPVVDKINELDEAAIFGKASREEIAKMLPFKFSLSIVEYLINDPIIAPSGGQA